MGLDRKEKRKIIMALRKIQIIIQEYFFDTKKY